MSGVLSFALLFAPLAYASNFASKIHASIYGTWVVLDKDMGSGVDFVTKRFVWEMPLHYPYALLGLTLSVLLFRLVLVNRDDVKKQKQAKVLLYLALLQLGFAVLLRVFATQHVMPANLDSDLVEAGFQREILLHLFVFYFIWRCIWKISPQRRAGATQQPAAESL